MTPEDEDELQVVQERCPEQGIFFSCCLDPQHVERCELGVCETCKICRLSLCRACARGHSCSSKLSLHDMEQWSSQGNAHLQRQADQGDEGAGLFLLMRLIALVERKWSPTEWKITLPAMLELVQEDVRWLVAFVRQLLQDLEEPREPRENPEDACNVQEVDWHERLICKIEEIATTRDRPGPGEDAPAVVASRAGLVILKMILRHPPRQHGTLERLLQAALRLWDRGPQEELQLQLEQLLDHYDPDSHFHQQLKERLNERAQSVPSVALRLKLALRAREKDVAFKSWENELMNQVEPALEQRLDRLGRFGDLVDRSRKVENFKREEFKDVALPTCLSTTITSWEEATTTSGANGARILKLKGRDGEGPEQEIKVISKCDDAAPEERATGWALEFMNLLIDADPEIRQIRREQNLETGDVKVSYSVVPIAPSHNLVEMVPDAISKEDLAKRSTDPREPTSAKRFLEYLVSKNEAASLPKARKVLAFTAAVSTVMSFVLGLGDRHAGNIMLTGSGRLFQIDFGFVLGMEPLHTRGYGKQPVLRLDYNEVYEVAQKELMNKIFWPVLHHSFRVLRHHYHILVEFVADIKLKVQEKEWNLSIRQAKRRDENRDFREGDQLDNRAWKKLDWAEEFLHHRLVPLLSEEGAKRFIEALVLTHRDALVLRMHDKNREVGEQLARTLSSSSQHWREAWSELPRGFAWMASLTPFGHLPSRLFALTIQKREVEDDSQADAIPA
ncbi:unnamed protein product [Effrenium voratum]|uniref:PI3K/PI4K catalytic domain-containing protein n=1 Tax=Effrenium voratum TaxID=2562239 RepID=A0AA36J9B4_9DINO|nr:unnamed protein product [Effrenium voratum]